MQLELLLLFINYLKALQKEMQYSKYCKRNTVFQKMNNFSSQLNFLVQEDGQVDTKRLIQSKKILRLLKSKSIFFTKFKKNIFKK